VIDQDIVDPVSPNNAINSDAKKLRCAPHLLAGHGERWASFENGVIHEY
jgi:hypothetical protein